MTLRRLLILGSILLVLFLGIYSWNQRTGMLDHAASELGLELGGIILTPLAGMRELAADFWRRYLDLAGVREENEKLRQELDRLKGHLLATGEDLAELRRLRELVQLPRDESWRPLGARVLAGRIGPNSTLDSITINRGYASGARPGTPIVTNQGLVGRVLRSSAHAATALLITDPGCRIAVFTQQSRAPGVLVGHGADRDMEVNFVKRDFDVQNGELLITSGLDGKFPKGLPVATVKGVAPSDYTQFLAVEAAPLVDLRHLEEVLLLEPTGRQPPEPEPAGPPPIFVGPVQPSRTQ